MIAFCCVLPASNKARDDDDDDGTLQMSLLKHNRRLKQSDSLPLNTVRGSGESEVPQCGPGGT